MTTMTLLLLITACSDHYTWVRKDRLDFAQQCLSMQQTTQKKLLDQQEQVADSLSRLNKTLSKPLEVKSPKIQIPTQKVCQMATPHPTTPVKVTKDNKQWVGSVEDTWFPQLDKTFSARIDTGAATSSLGVADYHIFERDGEKWVRFTLHPKKDKDDNDKAPEPASFERRLVRKVRILQASNKKTAERPVIKLQVIIGGVAQKAEFTLADRQRMEYRILIGRNVLRDLMVVDVGQKHLTTPNKANK